MAPVMRAMGEFTARKHLRARLMVEYLNGVNDRFEETEASLMLVLAYEETRNFPPFPRWKCTWWPTRITH